MRGVSIPLLHHSPFHLDNADMMDIGNWIAHDEAPIPSNVSLELLERRLAGTEKEVFLGFMRSMLKWMPEERWTAGELLGHEFLR